MIRAYPSIFLLLMIVPGIVLADQVCLPAWIFLSAAILAALLGAVWFRRAGSTRVVMTFGLALFFFSAFHYSLLYYPAGERHITNFAYGDQRYHIYGRVTDWPRLLSNRTELKVGIDSLISNNTYHVRGTVLLRLSDTTTSLQRGDRLEFFGRIYPLRNTATPGGFDYRRYLNLKGVHGIVYLSTPLDLRLDKRNRYGLISLVDRLRAAIVDSFNRNLSPRSAALAAGFLIGETRDIPADVYSWFRDSGTLHLLAVSGSNVALVLGFFIFLMSPLSLSRRTRTAVLLSVLLLFTLISYEEPSVVRASIMATLVLLSRLVQRRVDLNNIISATAAAILLYDPTQLFDVGFQLSFVTAWGLIFITPVVLKRFNSVRQGRWIAWVIFPIAVSIIAQICSGPLIAFYFQRIPVLSVPANIVIVLLTSAAVFGILGVVLADIILPLLGVFTGSLVNQLIEFILYCLKFFGGENVPIIETGSVSVWLILISYTYLILLVYAITSKRNRRIIVLSLVILVNLMLLRPVLCGLTNRNHTDVWLVSVPGGIAAVIQQNDQADGDLIITGLKDRDYPIDDRILVPTLERLGIKTINSMFVISSDYGSINDLVRTAERTAVNKLFVPEQLACSFRDVINLSKFNLCTEAMIVSQNIQRGHKSVGYYPFKNGVLFQSQDSSMMFVNKLVPNQIAEITPGRCDRLVVGRGVEISKELECWAVEYGISSIVARWAKWSGSKDYSSDLSPKEGVPIAVTDLSQSGALRLRLFSVSLCAEP
ncbi:MAG: hypothetical protein DRP47_01685 [Candidatus Zixiibacteriota bacterium]|nr:MAG: hypothetical protein DRP47_01685 [candidate division Zixibacteria bacterium]